MLTEELKAGAREWCRRLVEVQERARVCCAVPAERRDAAEHRRHILAVARRLVAERGVEDLSMHQLAQMAGVGQGTLYRRFAHKGELCMALLAENIWLLQADLRAYFASCAPSTPALSQLDHVLTRYVAFIEENAPILDAACDTHRATLYDSPVYHWMRETIELLLERAIEEGEIAPLDAPYAAQAILAALSIDLYTHQRHVQGFTPERIIAGLHRLYVEGLAGSAPGLPEHP